MESMVPSADDSFRNILLLHSCRLLAGAQDAGLSSNIMLAGVRPSWPLAQSVGR
jgi:hypothetical protein